MSAAFCFSNKAQLLEYYHNSSWLEHGGSPEHAVRTAFVYQINKYLKDKNLYKKGESAIWSTFRPVSPPAPAMRTRQKKLSPTSSSLRP